MTEYNAVPEKVGVTVPKSTVKKPLMTQLS